MVIHLMRKRCSYGAVNSLENPLDGRALIGLPSKSLLIGFIFVLSLGFVETVMELVLLILYADKLHKLLF